MKELKKETKIVVGVSITLVLLAIIVTVVILAVKSAQRGTQLLSREFVYVENDDGAVTMRDGLFVAATDGGYVLVKEDKIVSKKYAQLRLVDEKEKIYEFASFDGGYGRINASGSELVSVKSNGNFIGDTAQFTDFDFCYRFENGKIYAGLCEKPFDKVFRHSETEVVFDFLGADYNENKHVNVLPSGVFFAVSDGKCYIASYGAANTMIELNELSIERLSYDFITLGGAEGYKTYKLPDLEYVSELDGVSGGDILAKDGKLFRYNAGKVSMIGGAEFEVPFKPDKVVETAENKALLTGDGQGVFYNDGVIMSGRFEDHGVLYRVGDAVVYSGGLGVSGVEGRFLTRVDADDKIFFFVGEINGGKRALYEFENGALEFRSDSASTTYENAYFESSRYRGVYDTYFMYDGRIYDTDFNIIGSGRIVRKNLIENGSTYTDKNGNNVVENVERFYDVYDFKYEPANEYVFAKADGLYTAKDKLSVELDSPIEYVFKAENGVYVIKTEKGLTCANSVIYDAEDAECVFMSNSNIALISDTQVRVVKATKRGFENVATYGVFGATLDEKYKAANWNAYGFTLGNVSASGVVFKVSTGKKGFVNSDGRLALPPVYDDIKLTESYAIVKNNGVYAVADFHGKFVTDFEYVNIKGIGAFAVCLRNNGSAEMINARGNNVAKDVIFGNELEVNNYVTINGKYVIDTEVDYAFVNVNGKYRLIRICY